MRLWRAGFSVFVLESDHPIAVRRTVSFAEAVYAGSCKVEETVGRHVSAPEDVREALYLREVPVVVDPGATCLTVLKPYVVVDAIMAKRNVGTSPRLAPLVIALGPGFQAPVDCHAVIETNRGPHLGRVIWRGSAQPDTGKPAAVAGAEAERVLRSSVTGRLRTAREIGDTVEKGDVLAWVSGEPVYAPFRGLLRGLAHDGIDVRKGMKIGDVDPRIDPELCRLVSDKALAIAGGVLEAILMTVAREWL